MTPRDWATVAMWGAAVVSSLAAGLAVGLVGAYMQGRSEGL